MSAVWPASLPTDLLLSHREGPPANVVAFRPQVGAPALYQIGDSPARPVRGRMRLSDAQRATFLTFYAETLAQGSRQFELTSASFDDATWLCQFDDADPYALEGAAAGWWIDLGLVLVRQVA